jgi:uncharacterized tellurite resistance protein B-like protein
MRFFRPAATSTTSQAETEAVRHIVERLEAMPAEEARFLAGTAYVLARAANADLDISAEETAVMEHELVAFGLDESQSVLVVEMAKLQARTTGATSDFLVTRDFRESSTPEQRLWLVRACFRVAAADTSLSGTESSTLDQIANELDIPREDVRKLRAEFASFFSARLTFGQ